jgi:predicted  nucleic acid-binding Zn-ribbon protein
MFAVQMQDRSATERTGPRGWTSIVRLLLATGLLAPIEAALAEPASEPACSQPDQGCGPSPRLDQLSLTIGKLKASLSAIRQDLEAAADQAPRTPLDRLCAVPLAEAQAARNAAVSKLEQARATAARERAEWDHAEAAMTGELVSLRGRLAAAEAEVVRLTDDRATLVSHIVEIDETLGPSAGEEVAARAEPWRASPIHSAEAAEIEAVPQPAPMLPVAQHDQPAVAPPPPAVATGNRAPASRDRLQLQAELALAQLKIAELSTALESARLRQEAMEAEVGTLRSLTDDKIRQLLGWH